mmetsp:Transcript_4068/g.9610  ORF Transcript_4068/g.9610 Transcript_4068/m.9610 type:complete len:479 (+) Transcript_4068:51-1487(+)
MRNRRDRLPTASLWAVTSILFLWFPGACAGHGGNLGHATTLTSGVFDKFLAEKRESGRACLVMFHVSWCKVCQRTFPKFAAASDKAAERQIKMDFAHVDCTDDKSLCQRFDIKGYPSIRLFSPDKEPNTDPRSYKGQRNEEHFVAYAERMTEPAVRVKLSAKEFTQVARREPFAAFVAASPSNKPLPAGLLAAAEKWMDRHLFAAAPRLSDLLPEGVQLPASASLVVVSQGVQQWPGRDNTTEPVPAVVAYRGSLDDVEGVEAWVERNRFPGIWALNETNLYEFTHASRTTAIVTVDPERVSRTLEGAVRDAADKYGEKLLLGVLDGVNLAEELQDFNLYKKDLPRVLVTEDNFDTWIEDIELLRAETLVRDLKSLMDGAPLLRQGKGTLSRLKFYMREAQRFALLARAYAARGPMQAAMVCTFAFGMLLVLFFLGWCLRVCCEALLTDPDEDVARIRPSSTRTPGARSEAARPKKQD